MLCREFIKRWDNNHVHALPIKLIPFIRLIGCGFVSYYLGVPYLHPINPDKWNEFYGQSVDMIVVPSFNKFPTKQKHFIAIELQSDKSWFIVDVETNDPKFSSEIPPVRFKRVGEKINAGFLGNINGRNGLYNGQLPSGYFCSPTFIKDNSNMLVYNSIDNEKRQQFCQIDLIMVKFSVSEQSGMDQNL